MRIAPVRQKAPACERARVLRVTPRINFESASTCTRLELGLELGTASMLRFIPFGFVYFRFFIARHLIKGQTSTLYHSLLHRCETFF